MLLARDLGRAGVSLSLCLICVTQVGVAQIPNAARAVHPSIAPSHPLVPPVRRGTAPKLQYPDGKWNHGEGFAPPGMSDADYGGWFFHDNGRLVTSADIHLTCAGWLPFTWVTELHAANGAQMQRLQGYLRPASEPLPTFHPR